MTPRLVNSYCVMGIGNVITSQSYLSHTTNEHLHRPGFSNHVKYAIDFSQQCVNADGEIYKPSRSVTFRQYSVIFTFVFSSPESPEGSKLVGSTRVNFTIMLFFL